VSERQATERNIIFTISLASNWRFAGRSPFLEVFSPTPF
jgi:hypothetical protein